jgi:hypothetical protein
VENLCLVLKRAWVVLNGSIIISFIPQVRFEVSTAFSGLLRHVALVRTDVLEELS